VDCYLYEDQRTIHISSNGVKDEALLGHTYEIFVKLENEIEQRRDYVIEVVAKVAGYETEEGTDDKVIIIDDLETIESIVVKYAEVSLKGLLTIQFSEFVTVNSTSIDTNSTESNRLLQTKETS